MSEKCTVEAAKPREAKEFEKMGMSDSGNFKLKKMGAKVPRPHMPKAPRMRDNKR